MEGGFVVWFGGQFVKARLEKGKKNRIVAAIA